jgi:hypothetical protein
MKKKPGRKRGPIAETVQIHGGWEKAIAKALKTPKPS